MKVEKEDCAYNSTIENMSDDIGTIKTDVKSLLRFKWLVVGGSTAVSGIIAIVISLLGLKK